MRGARGPGGRGQLLAGLLTGLLTACWLPVAPAAGQSADPHPQAAQKSDASTAGAPAADLLYPIPDLAERRRLLALARLTLTPGGAGGPLGAPSAELDQQGRRYVALLSLGRVAGPALVSRGEGGGWELAVSRAAARLAPRATAEEIAGGLLKLDLLTQLLAAKAGEPLRFDSDGRAVIDRGLDGLWLPGPDLILLPEELLARRLVSSSGDLQSRRLRRYLAEGGREPLPLTGKPGRAGTPYRRLRFVSLAETSPSDPDAGEAMLYRGNPLTPAVSPPALLAASLAGGDYLLRHLRPDGSFGYSYEAKWDAYRDDYNLLRHAGSCYALLELSRDSGEARFREGAERALSWLLAEHLRGPRPEDRGADFAAIVSPGEEAKLGGAALALLALVEQRRVAGGEGELAARWLPTARALARFLLFQQGDDGRFASKYFYGEPDAEPFESIYYPGEAILALTGLYRVDPDPRWLAAARRGADYLILERDAGKATAELPHDHWLLMALEELVALGGEAPVSRGRADYAGHAGRIAAAIVGAQRAGGDRRGAAAEPSYPDWTGSYYTPPRSTPTATRSEALVAMARLARATGGDEAVYLAALERAAAFQLRTQLTPPAVLYLPRPDRALGGFRRSLTHWEVRIDYVQHNLSALLGLRRLLLEREKTVPAGGRIGSASPHG